jgi:dienelactone hydrolase
MKSIKLNKMKNSLIIITLSLLAFSCNNTSAEKRELIEVDTKLDDKENLEVPNIFVVKTTIFSKDSLLITADIYEVNEKKPTILLCHQAGFSRGEYNDTALELMNLGYSSMAIDQRSGNEANGVKNETAEKAKNKGLSTNYIDAKQDIEAAIDYMYELNGQQPIILVGSSYSATLALLIGKDSNKVKAIVAFSPGEYYKGITVREEIKDLNKPTFVTSSKKEAEKLSLMISLTDSTITEHYIPKIEGIHGSRALWESTYGNKEYWNAFKLFLQKKGVK